MHIQAIDAINIGETSGLTAEFYSQRQLCEPGGQYRCYRAQT